MVKNKIALIGTVFLCFVSLFGHTQASAEHKDSLKNVIRKYYAAELKVIQRKQTSMLCLSCFQKDSSLNIQKKISK